ncbi:MAG: amidohydrolase [Bacilli bacterium]
MIIIKNAYVIGMNDINYVETDVGIDETKIVSVGKINESDFPHAKIIDAKGKTLTPGLIDPHCHIGMMEEAIGSEGRDVNEMTNPVYPELRAIDAIKYQDTAFMDSLKAGVTTVVTGPGSANVIGGVFSILKTFGKDFDDMVLVEESCIKMALGENPKRVYGAKNQAPTTRMSSAALIRESLIKARDYREKKLAYLNSEDKSNKSFEFNMKWESLMRVFDGFLVKIHAHQQDDIQTALRIINEFNLNATIEHATEGHLIPEILRKNNQKVILGPTFGSKSKYELRNKSFESAKILKDNDVLFAIMTDHPVIESQYALTQLGLFVRAGLNELDALKAVTINAAIVNGIENRVGSIESGKDADIVIWDGHPLHYLTKPEIVIVNGKIAYQK